MPVQNGKPQGTPQLVKSDVGPFYPLGLTRSGALYYGVKVGGPDIYVVPFDFSAGKLLAPASAVTTQFMGSNRTPDWSPDGKYLAYVTQDQKSKKANLLTIHSMETGVLRQLHPRLSYIQWPRWSPDGAAFLAFGIDLKGRPGIYRIDAQTGDAAVLVAVENSAKVQRNIQWAPDGRRIYYGLQQQTGETSAGETAIIERDLVSGKDRELFRKNDIRWQSLSVSPDGRSISVITAGKSDPVLSVIPVNGGAPREVLRKADLCPGFTAWTPDSQQILLSCRKEIWQIPVSGGAVKKVNIGLEDMRGIRVQPGGNQLVFFKSTSNPDEIWTLENFRVPLTAKK